MENAHLLVYLKRVDSGIGYVLEFMKFNRNNSAPSKSRKIQAYKIGINSNNLTNKA
jgi:hypothetical protein